MKFRKISYHNYRCLIDSEIDFTVSDNKNIVLIEAPNGGGKTEIAFSFWWVLYGFDFKTLRGKKATAYALNSSLHKQLENGKVGDTERCWVELSFDGDDKRTYVVKRTGIFVKKTNIVSSLEEIELYYYNENGEKSLLIKDSDQIFQILSRVIPRKILAGLIFDGERMQQMSDEDKKSQDAVEGVIKHVTNEALFELVKSTLKDIHVDNKAALKKLERELDKESNSTVESEIQIAEDTLENAKISHSTQKQNNLDADSEIKHIHEELEKHQESKQYEVRRQQYLEDVAQKEKQLSIEIDTFFKDLEKGYLLITDQLISEIRSSLETYDVPSGLTTQAVNSILLRPKCICGRDLGPNEVQYLKDLLASLPPDNISSTIQEMTRSVEIAKEDANEIISRSNDRINILEDEIQDLKKKIANISTLITKGASETIIRLERTLSEQIIKRDTSFKEAQKYATLIKTTEAKLEKLKQIREKKSYMNADHRHFTKREKFVEKCNKAIEAIDERNKIASLENINAKLDKAYSTLSADYALGKRIYVIQYDESKRYTLVSYKIDALDRDYSNKQAAIMAWKSLGDSDEVVKEKLILSAQLSGSTGQNKVSALAFAKAILDYSREERNEDNFVETTRSYPFLVDSPFTELDGENMDMAADAIPFFSAQIILLASKKSLDGIKERIYPYIIREYTIEKIDNEHTQINKL